MTGRQVNLTQSERARLYCALMPCSYHFCDAKRGEYCRRTNHPQRIWLKSWHGNRGRDVQSERKANPMFREQYKKLVAQIVAERGVASGVVDEQGWLG